MAISVVFVVVTWTCIKGQNIESDRKPNVIIIFSNDMGYADGTGGKPIFPLPCF